MGSSVGEWHSHSFVNRCCDVKLICVISFYLFTTSIQHFSLSLSIYIYIYINMCMHIHLHIYNHLHRYIEIWKQTIYIYIYMSACDTCVVLHVYISLYIFIVYIYVFRCLRNDLQSVSVVWPWYSPMPTFHHLSIDCNYASQNGTRIANKSTRNRQHRIYPGRIRWH